MVKGDQDGLKDSDLYMENQDMFNYYLQCIIEFSQQFDPTETLMIIANDPERRDFIHLAPETLVPLSFITTDLWPKLGFLPIDPENPGVALIAEFMLNELVLKNSDSLDKLNLQHLKELFSGEEGDDEENEEENEEDVDEDEMQQVMEDMEAAENDDDDDDDEMQYKRLSRSKKGDIGESRPDQDEDAAEEARDKNSDNYSSDDDDDDLRAMDIGALRKQREQAEAKKGVKSESGDEAYEDDFN